jgi:hypothetical protein
MHSSSIAVQGVLHACTAAVSLCINCCCDVQQLTEGQHTTTQQLAAPWACIQHHDVARSVYTTNASALCKQVSLQRTQPVCVRLAGRSRGGALCALGVPFSATPGSLYYYSSLACCCGVHQGGEMYRQCAGWHGIRHATPGLDAVALPALVVHVVVGVGHLVAAAIAGGSQGPGGGSCKGSSSL